MLIVVSVVLTILFSGLFAMIVVLMKGRQEACFLVCPCNIRDKFVDEELSIDEVSFDFK